MRWLNEEASGKIWSMSISNCNFDSLIGRIEIDGNDVLLLIDSKATDVSIASTSTDSSNTNVSERLILIKLWRSITNNCTMIELVFASIGNRLRFGHSSREVRSGVSSLRWRPPATVQRKRHTGPRKKRNYVHERNQCTWESLTYVEEQYVRCVCPKYRRHKCKRRSRISVFENCMGWL